MPYVITDLCLRDGSCKIVCPVDCIVPGMPIEKYPKYYIDPETCIDCSACIGECPHGAIFPDQEVPKSYIARGNERISKPVGSLNYNETYDYINHVGEPIHLITTRQLIAGESVDLTSAIEDNAKYFSDGPGYTMLE